MMVHAYIIDPVLSKIIKMKLFVLFTSAVFAARARREQVPSWVNPEEQAQVVTVRKFFDLINQEFLKDPLIQKFESEIKLKVKKF